MNTKFKVGDIVVTNKRFLSRPGVSEKYKKMIMQIISVSSRSDHVTVKYLSKIHTSANGWHVSNLDLFVDAKTANNIKPSVLVDIVNV